MGNFGVGICENCGAIKQWNKDQQMYRETYNEEYDYTSPCVYCSLNNNPYTYQYMKIFYLKQIRKRIYEQYEVRKSDARNVGDKPWRIWTGPKTYLADHEYATKEEALAAMRKFWWEEADKFRWKNKQFISNRFKR